MKRILRILLSAALTVALLTGAVACSKKGGSSDTPPPPPVESDQLTLSSPAVSLDLYQSDTIKAYFNDEEVTPSYSIADSNVATVSANGLITAKAIGDTEITAVYNGFSTKCAVSVADSGERPSLIIPKKGYTLPVGGDLTITPLVKYKGSYISADISVNVTGSAVTAAVSGGKIVMAAGSSAGECKLTVSGSVRDWILDSYEINVKVVESTVVVYEGGDVYLTAISLNPTDITEQPVSVRVVKPGGAVETTPTINWQSSNSAVAVYDSGVIRAVGVGECDITASYQSIDTVISVTVSRAVKNVGITDVVIGGNVFEPANERKTFDITKITGALANYSGFTVYDNTNKLNIPVNLSGSSVTVNHNYGNVYGEFEYVVSNAVSSYNCTVMRATHIIDAPEDFYDLGALYKTATNGNTDRTEPGYENTKPVYNQRNDTTDWYVALYDDIDMSTAESTKQNINAGGFGDSFAQDKGTAVFQGIFDGRGHAIKNAKMSHGIVRHLGYIGKICNVAVINATRSGSGGGVLGHGLRGSVNNCYASGTVECTGEPAGLFYYGEGSFTGVIANVHVPNENVGIFKGHSGASNAANITHCYSIGSNSQRVDGTTEIYGSVCFDTPYEFKNVITVLPASFNSLWKLDQTGLYFGSNLVCAF